MKRLIISAAILTATAAMAGSASAATVTSDLTAWESAVGTWAETTNLGVSSGTNITSATLNGGATVSFPTLTAVNIGSGWSTWSGGYTGQVLVSYSTGSLTSETWDVSSLSGFGMFLEPDPFGLYDITLTLSSGETLSESVQGDAGASFFGWVGDGVTSFTISSSADFAAGDFYTSASTSPVPEPITLGLLATGLIGLGAARRRKADAA
jgi:hypothetical protein